MTLLDRYRRWLLLRQVERMWKRFGVARGWAQVTRTDIISFSFGRTRVAKPRSFSQWFEHHLGRYCRVYTLWFALSSPDPTHVSCSPRIVVSQTRYESSSNQAARPAF